MLRAITLAAVLSAALVAVTVVHGQTPTPSPYGGSTGTQLTATPETLTPATVTSTPATGTPPPIVTTTPSPTATPTLISDGGEPPFNYDIVKEIVAPLIDERGTTHYVTLSQDSAGVVRARYSLFNFPEGFYTVYLHEIGRCSPAHQSTGVVWAQLRGIPQSPEGESHLVLHFYNTDTISLSPGVPNSIYDEDGTSLALSVDSSEDNIAGRDVACAILAPPLGAPDAGSGHLEPGHTVPRGWLAIGAALTLSLGAIVAAGHRHRRRSPMEPEA